MRDKVIIDGVDVSECGYCLDGDCLLKGLGSSNSDTFCFNCQNNNNCYFKQLQRLKAENDGLKSQLDFEIQKRETVEAENEELKRKNTILELVTEPQRQEIEKYQDKALKFKKALEEIQNVLFPKNKLLITDCKGLLKTQEILNEVLKDEN